MPWVGPIALANISTQPPRTAKELTVRCTLSRRLLKKSLWHTTAWGCLPINPQQVVGPSDFFSSLPTGRGQGEGCENPPVIPFAVLRGPGAGVQPAPKDGPWEDERLRATAVGTWTDNYQGKRTLILRDDGTGTMTVELSGVRAVLFVARLQFEMRWSVKEGFLHKQALSGEPKAQARMVLDAIGDRTDERILELSKSRMLLLDKDGKTKYDWQRVREPPPGP